MGILKWVAFGVGAQLGAEATKEAVGNLRERERASKEPLTSAELKALAKAAKKREKLEAKTGKSAKKLAKQAEKEAKLAAKEAKKAAKQAERAKVQAERQIEDELAALKKKL